MIFKESRLHQQWKNTAVSLKECRKCLSSAEKKLKKSERSFRSDIEDTSFRAWTEVRMCWHGLSKYLLCLNALPPLLKWLKRQVFNATTSIINLNHFSLFWNKINSKPFCTSNKILEPPQTCSSLFIVKYGEDLSRCSNFS